MSLDATGARDILEKAHAAWTRGDLEETLRCYHDQIAYSGNIGGPDGKALVYTGKSAMRAFLEPILRLADCISTPLTFAYRDGVGRAQIHFQLRHKETGNVLRGTFRQIVKFQDEQIISLNEFHDAARMNVFWSMVQGPANPVSTSRPIISKLLTDALGSDRTDD